MAKQKSLNLRYIKPEVLQKIGSLELAAREVVEGLRVGMHKSTLRGYSTEFAHHRPYVPGDDSRRIDWRVYGRTERYYIRLYEAETNFDANLLVDASSSMRYGSGPITKMEYAKFMAASLAYMVVDQRDSAGMGVFDSELRRYVEPSSTMGVIRNIDEELGRTQGEPRTNVAAILHEFARRIPRRGFVMLFSDLLDNVEEFVKGLNHLRFRGHNVTVFHVLDPWELEFPFTGTCKFLGLENEPEIITQPQRVRQAYLAEVGNFTQKIRRACEQIHADYVLVNTARPLETVLAAYLLQRLRATAGTRNR